MSEWIAVLAKIQPVGEKSATDIASQVRERPACLLDGEKQPMCKTVKLERIVDDQI